jgi:periplasmic divalent cation tolerance protein
MGVAAGEFVVALTTLGSSEQARAFVRRLVDERLIACGTVVPRATSIYRWRGQVTEAEEVVVLLKTAKTRWAELEAAVKAQHPYEVPELLALPVTAGLEGYLKWMESETI